ncbi:hypothetical protein [Cellulomonas fengjieae]|uniref:Integral membrane protein n=1 Tax=Cellulomonas fengjieae TaxID=2819978 RepID=A0ABS3SD33_9CELL|nr:hypothetical protein [Cellulomonas fengjieae]MBO3083655.1 hypothetical protein [Cellulomonas fengjieae]MBO3101593.1 hypothetical protein [Cellulomonas fengjieae]QVI65034.1 hypothetical protein KG102_12920 [Cellulomonas fengjieae]
MDLVYNLLVVLHLIGWAIVLGGTLVNLRAPKIATGVLHGILTALVTGILLVGIASAGLAGHEPNTTKIAVKLVVAVVVAALVIIGVRKPSRVTTGYLGAIAGLTVVNIAVAVLWR